MIAQAPPVAYGRGLVRTLSSPHPLGEALPALFQEDGFTQRFMSAFDSSLAPIFATLDNLTAYLDPWLAPPDFLEWLGSWFGLVLDEAWSVDRRRAVLANAFEFYRMRGTVKGLKAQVETLTGGTAEIIDTGGVATSTKAGEALPLGEHVGRHARLPRDERVRQKIALQLGDARPIFHVAAFFRLCHLAVLRRQHGDGAFHIANGAQVLIQPHLILMPEH